MTQSYHYVSTNQNSVYTCVGLCEKLIKFMHVFMFIILTAVKKIYVFVPHILPYSDDVAKHVFSFKNLFALCNSRSKNKV